MRRESDVFEYFRNRPTVVGRLVTERVRGLVKPRINLPERIVYRFSDRQYCARVRHELDSINLLGQSWINAEIVHLKFLTSAVSRLTDQVELLAIFTR